MKRNTSRITSWPARERVRLLMVGLLVLAQFCLFPRSEPQLRGQIKPIYDQGALGLGRLLKRLNTSASAMMIGAHPDDEDTALLSYLARGENARTAYLSLTRGDGGQNIVGPELGEALGVIRTEELLQARKLDGAEQYFTRAYDYGFSKTLAEAKSKWDEKVVLCDAVRAIRTFRPLVVVSQFSGTTADGHGQHQFAGYIAPIAVQASADPAQCPGAGPPWSVRKFYIRHRGQGEAGLRVNTGKYDPMLGRSYFEIAMEARSQHRSQEQGVLELKGEAFSQLNLVGTSAVDAGIFDSIDTSVVAIAKNSDAAPPPFTESVGKVAEAAARALDSYDVRDPARIIPILIEGYGAATDALASAPSQVPKAIIAQKQNEFVAALRLAAGIQLDVISDRETVVPDESFTVTARVFHPPDPSIVVKGVTLRTPRGWTVSSADPAPQPQAPQFRREVPRFVSTFSVKTGSDARPTQPYWLGPARKGDLFDWSDVGPEATMPFQAPEAVADIRISIEGKELTFTQPVEYRYADDVRGELRRLLAVVPTASVSLDQDLLIISRTEREVVKNLAFTVTNNTAGPLTGKLALTLPPGWTAATGDPEIKLERKGESTSVQFTVKAPPGPVIGSYPIAASFNVGGTAFSRTMRTVAYPHIQTHRIYGNAVARAVVIDLKTKPARIGYIPGSGDSLPQAIAQMGLKVDRIEAHTLASGDLSQFDVIVVGIRAYQVRTDIVAHNKRLLDFAKAGGTLLVQYQLAGYTQQNLAPFPARQGPRVSDEQAKVTLLDPGHPILSSPNKITDADFAGWVQERNLYNFSTMDPQYTGLLEAHDLNEPENKGGLVVADIGKGKYIYCSYSLFRQLPAGVPGAYRLLANILAYSGDASRRAQK